MFSAEISSVIVGTRFAKNGKIMDSPKCPNCLQRKKISQTYKKAGVPKFQCAICGVQTLMNKFKDIDFKWKTHPKDWEKSHKLKLKAK